MKCRYCGAELTDDQLICSVCGTEIQVVPDYNPLDDVLADEVRGGLTQTLNSEKIRENSRRQNDIDERERERIRQAAGKTGKTGRTGKSTVDGRERRRRQEERRRIQAKKRRKKLILIGVAMIALLVIVGVIFYQNSYTGQVKKGYKYLQNAEYEEAIARFQKAIDKKEEKSDAYTGLAEVYVAQKDLEKAENVFLTVLKEQPDNLALYEAAIGFYIDIKQENKIAYLLDSCKNDSIVEKLAIYASDVPQFSLDEEEVYDDIQALELESSGKAIYYTTDQTDPTTSSIKYTEPIKLEEGTTEIRAISVNEKGIPSMIVTKIYTVEFPMADAPSVTPSTGQYTEAQTIKVVVPENYEAYYSLDGSKPVPGASNTMKYTGEFSMPEGSTIFKVVLVDQKGRISDITTRNYELILDSE